MVFHDELQELLNKWNMENGSDTPDFILANFLSACLAEFDNAVVRRTKWYARLGEHDVIEYQDTLQERVED